MLEACATLFAQTEEHGEDGMTPYVEIHTKRAAERRAMMEGMENQEGLASR